MKKLASIATALCIVFLATCARAQNFYQGLDYTSVIYKEYGVDAQAHLKLLRYKIGIRANDNLAFEGHIGKGIGSDTVNVEGIPISMELDTVIGFYAHIIIPVKTGTPEPEEKGQFYVILGYTHGSATASAYGISVSDSDSDFTYGFGGEAMLGKNFGVTFEYAQFADDTESEYSGFSTGIKIHF